MSDLLQFGFESGDPRTSSAPEVDEETPLHILVLGDFSGRANRGVCEPPVTLAGRPILSIDLDNFNERLARLAPRLALPLDNSGGSVMTIGFSSLDDFHPDQLYERLEVFAGLRQMRGQLLNPKTFDEAAAALRRAAQVRVPPVDKREATPPVASASPNPAENDVSLLGLLPETERTQTEIAQIVRGIVAPYVLPKADPLQKVYVASVEQAMAEQMRQVLHQRAFQALEAAWRGIRLLVSRLETGPQLKVFFLDVSREELADDLATSGGNPANTGLYKRLVEKGVGTRGSHPWSLVVGNFMFGASASDVELLAALGAVASLAGGPFLAAARPEILGCQNLAETPDPDEWQPLDAEADQRWKELRAGPAARWIGLALPRVLLRLPYGKQYSPVEQFAFEELTEPPHHEAFLWGHPAFACAQLLGASFSEHGWSMTPGDRVDVDDLPACVLNVDGEAQLLPCGEVYLSERAADAILARGVMPVISYQNRNAVRVARFQSLADPPEGLAGAWG